MKRFNILLLSTVISLSVTYAQGFGYDSKTDIGNGLYKVKSGESQAKRSGKWALFCYNEFKGG